MKLAVEVSQDGQRIRVTYPGGATETFALLETQDQAGRLVLFRHDGKYFARPLKATERE